MGLLLFNTTSVVGCRLQYFILVIVIFLLETIASVLAFVYRSDIEVTVKRQLLYVVKEKWSDTDEEGWKEGFAYTHQSVCTKILC